MPLANWRIATGPAKPSMRSRSQASSRATSKPWPACTSPIAPRYLRVSTRGTAGFAADGLGARGAAVIGARSANAAGEFDHRAGGEARMVAREVEHAARDLVGGALVVEGDVAVARWPAQVAPPGRLTEPGQALGRALTTSVGAGEALTPTRLLKSGTGPPGGADRVVTAVAGVDRATLGVLRAEDRVDLLTPATGATLADAALVVADPVVASGDDLGPDGAAGSVLLALRPAEAVALARARADLDLPLVVVVRARPG